MEDEDNDGVLIVRCVCEDNMAGTGSGCGILLLSIQAVLSEKLLLKTYSNAYTQKHHNKALNLDSAEETEEETP